MDEQSEDTIYQSISEERNSNHFETESREITFK